MYIPLHVLTSDPGHTSPMAKQPCKAFKVSEGNCGVRTELCMLNTCMSVLSVSAYNVA